MVKEAFEVPAIPQPWAIALIAASALFAAVGLFVLPGLRSLGLSFNVAFWIAAGMEFVGAIGVVVGVLNLHKHAQ